MPRGTPNRRSGFRVPSQQPGFLVASPDPPALREPSVSTPPDSPNQSGRVSRGTLLKRTGAIALGTSLFSMGDPLTVLAVQTKRTALKPDGDLAYFNWAQYINPKLLRGFEKEYGVKVKESNFTNMETMLAKIRAGVKYDVAFPEAQTAAQLVQAKLPRAARPRQAHELGPGQRGLPQPVVRRGRQVHGAVRDLDDRHRLPHGQGQGHDGVLERPLEPPRGGQAHVPARRLPRGHRDGPARDRHEGRQLQELLGGRQGAGRDPEAQAAPARVHEPQHGDGRTGRAG